MKTIEEKLNIDPIAPSSHQVVPSEKPALPVESPTQDKTLSGEEDEDFAIARQNFHNIIEAGSSALDGALRVAEQSEHPRAFEVVSGLIQNLAAVNKQMLELGEIKIKIKNARRAMMEKEASSTPNMVTNNTAVFVGNSADLAKAIRGNLIDVNKK